MGEAVALKMVNICELYWRLGQGCYAMDSAGFWKIGKHS